MKKLTLLIAIAIIAVNVNAQKIFTKTGQITFHSDAPMEEIEAENNKATSVIDQKTGNMQWAVLVKAFKFEKSLMEEHFNENYMESSKFPKATFKGKIANLEAVDFNKDGEYTATIMGSLSMHGETKDIKTTATFNIKDGTITGTSEFEVLLADYKIEIPAVVADNISKTVLIKISASYEKLEK